MKKSVTSTKGKSPGVASGLRKGMRASVASGPSKGMGASVVPWQRKGSASVVPWQRKGMGASVASGPRLVAVAAGTVAYNVAKIITTKEFARAIKPEVEKFVDFYEHFFRKI